MANAFVLDAEVREEQGKGASRRLRHQGLIPAVVYGAGKDAQSITLKHNQVVRNLEEEAFYSQIITVNVGGSEESVILRDLQRHPYKPIVMHVDLQRVDLDAPIRVSVPVHCVGAEESDGVKLQGGKVRHLLNEVSVLCLPNAIPEMLEIDMSAMNVGETLHLSDLKLPEGVSIPELETGNDDLNLSIVALSSK